MINDAPVVLASQSEKQFWRPENDTRHFYGMTSLLVGLQQSRNIVAIRLLRLIGIPYAINYATRFGFNANKLPDGLSLALGTAEVTPLQMVTGYSVFANGGYKVTPHLISHVTNSYGKTIFQTTDPVACNKNDCKKSLLDKPKAQRVITPQNAFLMTQLMKAVINGGTGQAAMRLGRHDLAGKTGTTNQKIDAWFSGFNHTLAVTAWMGFDKPRPLYEYGAQAALPIWIHFMGLALKGKPESNLPEPPGIVSVRINPKTGKAASPSLRDGKFIYFRKQYAPSAASHNSTSSQNADLLEQEIY
jgi:penicillin-binding protein 1A